MARRWTKVESKKLLFGAGAFGISWLQRQTGPAYNWVNAPKHRSCFALKAKMLRMGLGGFTRGTWSLERAKRETGFTQSQLFRAMKALNQKWKRTGPRGDYLITDDQMDDILEWLKHDFWCKCKHLYCCVWCGEARRRHFSLGLCDTCYKRYLRFCVLLYVPYGIQKQKVLVMQLRKTKLEVHERKFLERITWRFNRKLALERGHLEWLSLLTPGVSYVARNS